MCGRISATYDGIIFDMSHDDLKGSKKEVPIQIMDTDNTKAIQL